MYTRRKLIESIRNDMSEKLKEKGEIGVVLDEDVAIAVERRVCMDYLASKKRRNKTMIINALKTIVTWAKRNEKDAVRHRYKKLCGRCFYAWSDHVYLVSVGLDRYIHVFIV